MFKKLRIMIWLYLLALVAGSAWLARERSTDWNEPLWVVVYPVAGDRSAGTRRFMDALRERDFEDIELFMRREAAAYGLPISNPVEVKLARAVGAPPAPPPPAERNLLNIMAWSLHMRYWAWDVAGEQSDLPADIRMFVTFHDPERHHGGHDSLAIREGLIGVVNAFATRKALRRNNVIIAHEMLHTIGATDKYDPATNLPVWPHGYAAPAAEPLHPQQRTEIMGGRRPVSATEARAPRGLGGVVIGAATALEIRWTE